MEKIFWLIKEVDMEFLNWTLTHRVLRAIELDQLR
jgi:hypothetical protein